MKTSKPRIGFLLLTLFFCSVSYAAIPTKNFSCQDNSQPQNINPLLDWDIVAPNTASISTSDAFKGQGLTYYYLAKPNNSKNLVSINHQTGLIRIKAGAKDKFNVKVIAGNHCGTASTTFNVVIDEDKNQ